MVSFTFFISSSSFRGCRRGLLHHGLRRNPCRIRCPCCCCISARKGVVRIATRAAPPVWVRLALLWPPATLLWPPVVVWIRVRTGHTLPSLKVEFQHEKYTSGRKTYRTYVVRRYIGLFERFEIRFSCKFWSISLVLDPDLQSSYGSRRAKSMGILIRNTGSKAVYFTSRVNNLVQIGSKSFTLGT
jgi:hypothetical protein